MKKLLQENKNRKIAEAEDDFDTDEETLKKKVRYVQNEWQEALDFALNDRRRSMIGHLIRKRSMLVDKRRQNDKL